MKKMMMILLVTLLGLSLWGCGSEPIREESSPTQLGEESKGRIVRYVIHVTDEKGTPIPNAMVQLCSDICVVGSTDETGTAEFTMEPADYKVSLPVMPQGYVHTGEETEFAFPEGSTELTIVLKAQ